MIPVRSNQASVKPYCCETCSYQGAGKGYFIKHLATIHNHFQLEIYSCDSCVKRFSRCDVLKSHITNVHYSLTGPKTQFFCSICNFQSVSKSNLSQHLKTSHEQMKMEVFRCDGCSREFKNRSNLSKHHCGLFQQEPLMCDICNYECFQIHSLAHHYTALHLKKKQFGRVFCDQCPATFNKSSLTDHLRSQHMEGYSLPTCNECGYSARKSHLMKHWKRRHSSVPRTHQTFSCDYCGRNYRDRGSFMNHISYHVYNL